MTNSDIVSEKSVLAIGAAGMDLVGRLVKEWQPGSSAPAHIRTTMGGVARNVAENLARLGQPTLLISAVGTDPAGEQILAYTADAGVNILGVLRIEQQPTGSYLAVIASDGTLRYALDDMYVVNSITPDYIRSLKKNFSEASLVFIDANLPKDSLRTVMSLARKTHCPVCADPTSLVLAPRLIPYLNRLALITPNAAEAAVLAEKEFDPSNATESVEIAKLLVARGAETVIITLAEFGLCYATTQHSGYIPAIRTKIIDPTGAGDALTAAVLMARLNDIPLDDAVRLGVAAASLTLRHPGAVYPSLSLEKLYEQF